MSIYRRRKHDIPELNTASLPDLIFTILFFFMLVTHVFKTILTSYGERMHNIFSHIVCSF